MKKDQLSEISEPFALCMRLGVLVGAAPLSKFEDCWEFEISESWWIAANGHKEVRNCSIGKEVDPLSILIFRNGVLVGKSMPVETLIFVPEVDPQPDVFVEAAKKLEIVKACGCICHEQIVLHDKACCSVAHVRLADLSILLMRRGEAEFVRALKLRIEVEKKKGSPILSQ